MAVAGCINAYDCSGNLIRTLEQLQSSNIGVGVQYTAPNPLDDKKINYIKYTDKCGCTCTLTGENEILIYATNGVIKNLSLTNDDTNERVIVKWNDVFGSNWLKTVVRYKTGSAPTSITDGTLAVEETTKNQYATNGYGVSGLSDDTTYYFSVFGVDFDGTVINVQSKAIKTDFFFAKFQKVEYIETTGTQWIDTGLFAYNNYQVETKIEITTSAQEKSIFGSFINTYESFATYQYYHMTSYQNQWYWGLNGSEGNGGSYGAVGTQYEIVYNNANNKVVVNNSEIGNSNGTVGYTGSKLGISIRGSTNQRYYGVYKYFYFKVYDKTAGQYIRDLVPCYRKSDNVIGLLDIVNKVFYTNQGSGSFTKGPNI